LTIENLTTGQVWSWTGTVAAGDTLDVDFENPSILNDGVDAIQYSVGDFPQLKLNPGGNQMKFTGSNCTIKVDYTEKYL
jgi:phage-related protein